MSNARKPSPAIIAAAKRLADEAPEFEASTLAFAVQALGIRAPSTVSCAA